MEEKEVVPEAPVAETPKATEVEESLIENRRASIEDLVITQNETFPEPEAPEAPKDEKPKEKKEEKVEERAEDPLDRIKKSVQKRIDKVVAQKKSAEEELAEARAEIERLKSRTPEVPSTPKDDTPPTPEQVEAYIAKMQEEGNWKEAAAATRYLVKLEKEMALKEIRETETKAQKEAEAKKARTDAELKALANDYVVYDESGNPDPKNDMTLANKNGLLYKTAIGLYNDAELHKDFYNDENVVNGFRRAVADAYREIHQQNLIKNTPKGEIIPRNPRQVLADPDAVAVEETQPNNSNSLSDAEKVREEIKFRNKNRFIRKIPQ